MAAVRSRMGADPFAEHGALMKDLYHEYSRREREDLDGMAAVRALLHEASVTAQSRQQRVQDIIEGMRRSVAELETLSTYPEPEGLHAKRVASLQSQAQAAQSSSCQLQQELKQLEERKQVLAAKSKALEERKVAVDKAATAEETLLRHQLSLFAHISKVTWRLDVEDRIAGTVSDNKTGDLRPFDIDPRSLDTYSVVNSLWQQL